MWDRVVADKSYLSQLLTHTLLHTRRLRLITHVKRNMATRVLLLHDTVLLRRRALVETVFDHRKHLMQRAHTRHRSAHNVAVNLVAGMVAYCHQPTKPVIYRGGRPQLVTAIPN